MDPKDKFKERYNEYLSERNKQIAVKPSSITHASPKVRSYSPNKFYVLGIIVGLLIVGPAAAYLILSNQIIQNTTPSHISSVNVTPVSKIIVTDAQIDTEMQKFWGFQYESVKNDSKLRAEAKQNIEIQRAAQKLGVSIATISSEDNNPSASYQKLQNNTAETLEDKVVTWRVLDSASLYTQQQGQDYKEANAKALQELGVLRNQLLSGKSMKDANTAAIKSLGYNPHFSIKENIKITKDSGWLTEFKKVIFTLKKGDVSQIMQSESGSFMVVSVQNAHDTQYASLSDFLKKNKQ